MKQTFLLCSLFCIATHANAQKIQYSRQSFKMPYADAVQLIANVGGYHHIICFNLNKPPVIHVFDAQLQLQEKKEIDMKLKGATDLRLIPFKNFYLLYAHITGAKKHELFKIDGVGNMASLSKPFQLFVDEGLNKNTSTLQLVNQNEKLFVVAHTYYDGIKKTGSNVVELDDQMNMVLARKVLYNFNRDADVLQQTVLAGNSLLVLKTTKDEEKGNSLDMIKIDLATGQSITNSFNSGTHFYTSPVFSFQVKDSTLLIYSLVHQPAGSERSQQTFFINHLDYSLQEITPVNLLQGQFRNGTAAAYFLFRDAWFAFNSNTRIRRGSAVNPETFSDASVLNMQGRQTFSSTYFVDNRQRQSIRLTLLDENLNARQDSLIVNDRKVYDVQPRPFAQFTINNKGCLFLIQNFSSDRRGLLMLNSNNNGQLTSTDIPVFDKYEYLLPQAKAVHGKYVLIPYLHRSDIGLVKISFD